MIVLDASAVLALVHDEPGAAGVEARLAGAVLSTVNLAEVVGKLVDAEVPVGALAGSLRAAGVVIEPLTEDDAVLAGALRSVEGGTALALGDRCCIAVAARHGVAVLTADRDWARLALPVPVELVR